MKKKTYLYCTNPLMYLTEIPPLVMFFVLLYYNDKAEGNLKFYPLMTVLVISMIFILVYLFRYITVSFDEIRCKGPFSSRDSAAINKDKTLILTMYPHKKLRIALFGNDGLPPMFDGLRGEPSIDIYLFRARAFGGKRAVSSVLRFYGIPEADIPKAFSEEKFQAEYKDYIFDVEHIEDIRVIKVKFKETL